MSLRTVPVVLIALLFAPAYTRAADDPLAALRWLEGDWVSVAKPGEPGGGAFSFKRELSGRVLVRHNAVDVVPVGEKDLVHHEDLLVVGAEGAALKATYWDSEGHVIRYAVTAADKRVVFETAETPGVPRFRLTYEPREGGIVFSEFAIAAPGKPFQTHVAGSARRR
jgi:hypothetical protein